MKATRHIYILYLLFWAGIFYPAAAQAQYFHAALQQQLDQARYTTLRDTLSQLALSNSLSKTIRDYYTMRLSLAQGDVEGANTILSALSKKEAATPIMQLAQAEQYALLFNFDKADEIIARLSKKRIRDTQIATQLERTRAFIAEQHRQAQGMRTFTTRRMGQATVSALEQYLRVWCAGLGEISADRFVTPQGNQKWQVIPTKWGGTTLALSHRLGDGEWEDSSPLTIKGFTGEGHISYPFLMPDGITLYFAYQQEGHTAQRDLYVTRFDRSTHELLVPQRLSMPFTTLGDELLYIVDESKGAIYYATNYGAPQDTYYIYEVDAGSVKALTNTTPEDLQNAAHPRAPLVTLEELEQQTNTTNKTAQETKEHSILLFVKGRAIYNEADLRTQEGLTLYERLAEVDKSITAAMKRVAELRLSFAQNKAKDQVRPQILQLEEEIIRLQQQRRNLLNELARCEGQE